MYVIHNHAFYYFQYDLFCTLFRSQRARVVLNGINTFLLNYICIKGRQILRWSYISTKDIFVCIKCIHYVLDIFNQDLYLVFIKDGGSVASKRLLLNKKINSVLFVTFINHKGQNKEPQNITIFSSMHTSM